MHNKKENLIFISSSYLRLIILFDEIASGNEFLESFSYQKNPVVKETSKYCMQLSEDLETVEVNSRELMLTLSIQFQNTLTHFLRDEKEAQYELFSRFYHIEDFDLFLEILFELTPSHQTWKTTHDFIKILKDWIDLSYSAYNENL